MVRLNIRYLWVVLDSVINTINHGMLKNMALIFLGQMTLKFLMRGHLLAVSKGVGIMKKYQIIYAEVRDG